ncbi:uncharacterized protein [Coffea arabica]|uniref:SWIM-type domain-containing protein n=1 Tax=Coffea arabica TaxID=13443 RepID=A0ABM4UKA0_COFAR
MEDLQTPGSFKNKFEEWESSKTNEEWNEFAIDDEELLDTMWGDDERNGKGNSCRDFNAAVEFRKSDFELKVGDKFKNLRAFREALVEWNVREGYTMKYKKNERAKVIAMCKKGCSWKIRASPIQNESTFQIKSIKGVHVCGREYSNHHANARYLSKKYLDRFRDEPSSSIEGFVKTVRREIMVDISMRQAYRAKRLAREALQGDDIKQYNVIRDYAATLLIRNPGSHIVLQVTRLDENEVGIFERMYWSLSAMKNGFLAGCRRIIGLDGCFLKSPFGGQLLTAMGRDGNDNMFPIAMAVVEAERYDSWKWFLMVLKIEVGAENGAPWTFISDRQKGLVSAIDDVFPESEHRYCLRHIYQNFKQKFKGKELKEYFWAAASAGNIRDFKIAMAELERADPKVGEAMNAAGWLNRIPAHLWSRSHSSSSCKSDILVNNLNKSFNSYILPTREFTIISMFEWIRRKLMQRLNVKREGMQQYEGNLCPNIQERLERNKLNSRFCIAHYSRDAEYEVDCGTRVYVVDISRRTCTCGSWQLSGIPCSHSIAAIQRDKSEPEHYVDPCYSKEAYLSTYNYTIAAMPSEDYWDSKGAEKVNPPKIRKQPGRPKKVRRREADEVRGTTSTRKGLVVHCKKCFRPGHNSRTCKFPIHPKSKFYKVPAGASDAGNAGEDVVNAGNTSIGSVSQQGSVSQPCETSAAKPVFETRRPTDEPVEPVLDTRRPTDEPVEPVLDTTRTASAVEPILDTRRSTRVRKLVPTVASVLENLRAKKAKRVSRM